MPGLLDSFYTEAQKNAAAGLSRNNAVGEARFKNRLTPHAHTLIETNQGPKQSACMLCGKRPRAYASLLHNDWPETYQA